MKRHTDSHSGISNNHAYLLRQLVVWQRLSVHLGWQCDNVRVSYDEVPKATQDEVFAGAKVFVKENKGRYECGGYIYSGEGQELGEFWVKLNVGNVKLQKISSNTSITDGNGNYSIAGATYGVFSDKDCTKQLATLTTDENENTGVAEVKVGTVYIKELFAPAGYKMDKTVYPLTIKAGETATLKEENAELLINGKRVESDCTFTADSENMKVEVAVTFDATSLDGKQLVTFEELYDLSNLDELKKVTEYKDIEDEGETITFKEKPEVPVKPETPQTPEKPNKPSDSPNVMTFVVVLLASAGGLAGTYLYKRCKMKKS